MEDKTRYVCSKMFKDVNIKFPYEIIKHCCQTDNYKVSLNEITNSKDVFLYTDHYMDNKRSMLVDNKLPANGCSRCIKTEPNSLFRSWNEWKDKKVYTNDDKDDLFNNNHFNYYEFVLTTDCDLKCIYCGPHDSSSWAKELGEEKRAARDEWQKSVEEKLFEHLRNKVFDIENEFYYFSFSGGEPTYNLYMINFMQEILNIIPKENSVIKLTTNLNTKERIFEKFLKLIDDNRDYKFGIDCSFEDIGKRCEAVRTGLNWNRAMSNMDALFLRGNVSVQIAPTLNIYSLPFTYECIKFFVEKFKAAGKFRSDKQVGYPIQGHSMFNHNMVQEDAFSPMSMPAKYKECLDPAIDYLYKVDIPTYAGHLERVKQLIGTKENVIDKIKERYDYFKRVRPEYDWDDLFPHINEIINA